MHKQYKFNEASLLEKAGFLSGNKRDINDANYTLTKRVSKDFEIKNIGEYHDFHIQSDTLLLVDAFNNFRNMCLEKYGLYHAHFLSVLALAWQAALEKTRVKLDLLSNIDMLLIVEKDARGEICDTIHQCLKTNNKYMKGYIKNKESFYLNYWNINNLYGQAISQKLPVGSFNLVENTSQLSNIL